MHEHCTLYNFKVFENQWNNEFSQMGFDVILNSQNAV